MIGNYLKRHAPNSSRFHLERINSDFAQSIPAGALVLDAGAGDAPYKPLLTHARYESADFELVDKPYAKSTYVCDLAAIPVEEGRFDFVVFNQVMEHLPEPMKVLKELHRVMKPGGKMIASAPLFYEEHEQPYDFYRYTQFAWRKMMADAGFEIERLEWMEGYYGTVGYQLETAAKYLPTRRSAFPAPVMFVIKWLFAILAGMFYRADMRRMHTTTGYPKNYFAIVRKPV